MEKVLQELFWRPYRSNIIHLDAVLTTLAIFVEFPFVSLLQIKTKNELL